MEFTKTILTKNSLFVLTNGYELSLPSLLSAARSEYLNTDGLDGPFMTRLTALLKDASAKTYAGGDFIWSDYNHGQWKKFAASEAASPEGGSCVFSCEPDGRYDSANHDKFRGLFIGVPTGMWPYRVSIRDNLAQITSAELRSWIEAQGYAAV